MATSVQPPAKSKEGEENVNRGPRFFPPAEDRKRLAWWMDLSCPLQGGYNDYYREVDGVRWPIHQDLDPSNPLGVERREDLKPTAYHTPR